MEKNVQNYVQIYGFTFLLYCFIFLEKTLQIIWSHIDLIDNLIDIEISDIEISISLIFRCFLFVESSFCFVGDILEQSKLLKKFVFTRLDNEQINCDLEQHIRLSILFFSLNLTNGTFFFVQLMPSLSQVRAINNSQSVDTTTRLRIYRMY
ncbi:hypothetical protein BpHYR1_031597 [Brachionus plicatilis]|uniref:Transmembrane protein n=1 Tax=Brachionus plicatilis TaxID=10195 RepID=A0A3M7T048_BRAPC|nr:hypothetical protein BpHYR1_031597 [Brachionus plicatilis]